MKHTRLLYTGLHVASTSSSVTAPPAAGQSRHVIDSTHSVMKYAVNELTSLARRQTSTLPPTLQSPTLKFTLPNNY